MQKKQKEGTVLDACYKFYEEGYDLGQADSEKYWREKIAKELEPFGVSLIQDVRFAFQTRLEDAINAAKSGGAMSEGAVVLGGVAGANKTKR